MMSELCVIEALDQGSEGDVRVAHVLGDWRHEFRISLVLHGERRGEAVGRGFGAEHAERDAGRKDRVEKHGRVTDADVSCAVGFAVSKAEVPDDMRCSTGGTFGQAPQER